MTMRNCPSCSTSIVSEGIYCPHCLSTQIETKEAWFPVTTKGSKNPSLQHILVPEHRLLPEERTKQLLREYNIDRVDLPKIKASDPAIKHLACGPGDVIEIVRDSRTTETARSYRLVISGSKSVKSSDAASEEWRNPATPAKELYERTEELSEEQALHILENLRAHIPPSQPGTCEAIAVNREEEITTAVGRVTDAVPYTFVEGELGYGKSFFLYWVRDRTFPTTAVSFVDLDETITFANKQGITDAFWRNLETPRSTVNDQYANGPDELWDTFLRKVADMCAGYYEGKGYELKKERVAESLSSAVEDIFQNQDEETEIAADLSGLAREYFDTSTRSLSQFIEDEVKFNSPKNRLRLISLLARLNGYRVLLGVDELEKSERTEEHFESLNEFIDTLPTGISLFVTGTPELLTGGQEGNTIRETYRPLYNRTINNQIVLEEPSQEELVAFAERLESVESQALDTASDREYSQALEHRGGTEQAVDDFLSETPPSFRAFLAYLETQSGKFL